MKKIKIVQRKLLKTKDLPRICMYCGDPATDREHVVPKSIVGENTDKVWSCSECNSIASDSLFETIEEKGEYIRAKLKHKYKKILEAAEWSDDEIEEMGYGMQKRIRSARTAKQWVKKRLQWDTDPLFLLVCKYIEEKSMDKVTDETLQELHKISPTVLANIITID